MALAAEASPAPCVTDDCCELGCLFGAGGSRVVEKPLNGHHGLHCIYIGKR